MSRLVIVTARSVAVDNSAASLFASTIIITQIWARLVVHQTELAVMVPTL
jgi:hypothetical protein